MTNLEANVRKLLGVLEAHDIDSYDCDRAGVDHCDCLATAVEGVERALRDNSESDCPAHGRETLAIGVLARFASYVDAVEAALLQTEVGRNAYPQYAANLSAAGTALKDVCIRAGRSLSGAEKAPCESPSLDYLLRELHGAVEGLVSYVHSIPGWYLHDMVVWQRLLAARNAVNNYGI
jgi:hypothetical protein